MKRYLITSALPYANGPIHLGHLAGAYLPADIYTRHHRLLGNKCIHISGSDEYGVAIMLNAQKAGKKYKKYVDEWHQSHKLTFSKMSISFDFFGQTSSAYHSEEVTEWFKAIHQKGLISPKEDLQLFCNDCKNHLPDRFVEGICHGCGYEYARGDECPSCGIIITPTLLKNPVCKICESKNLDKIKVTQWYLLLGKFHKEFREWFEHKEGIWRKTVYPFVDSLTKDGLHDRAITRDLDWGIDVPLNEAKGKKLYVWFDAPIGYVSNTKQYLKEIKSQENYLKDWWNNSETEITHFLAKDNVIFHTIIFPIMAMASERIFPPTDVPANQFLNLEGRQFSKSQGWYVDLDKALSEFGVDAIRYYLISILPEFSDSSFTWKEFQARVNGELANNIGNLVNRCLKFFNKNWPSGISNKYFADFSQSKLGKDFKLGIEEHNKLVESKMFRRGLEKVMSMGQMANTYFSDQAPWAQIKTDPELAKKTIANTSQLIFILGVLLSPYLPDLSTEILKFFGDTGLNNVKGRIYKGEIEALTELFYGDYKLSGDPSILVPKIENEIIEKLELELRSKQGA
jgi:methionyl-tRNA synthetase